jgi:hypothetical protein
LLLPSSLPVSNKPTKARHLYRSSGQLYRPLRSGETPHFAVVVGCISRLCCCLYFAVAFACSCRRILVVILREAEDLLLLLAVALTVADLSFAFGSKPRNPP